MYPREYAVVAERQTHHLEGVAGYARGGSNPLYRTKKALWHEAEVLFTSSNVLRGLDMEENMNNGIKYKNYLL
jgi:hypothetical protein